MNYSPPFSHFRNLFRFFFFLSACSSAITIGGTDVCVCVREAYFHLTQVFFALSTFCFVLSSGWLASGVSQSEPASITLFLLFFFFHFLLLFAYFLLSSSCVSVVPALIIRPDAKQLRKSHFLGLEFGFFYGFFYTGKRYIFRPWSMSGGENHNFFCPHDTFRTHLSLNMPFSPKILRTPRPISFVFGAPGGVDIDRSLTQGLCTHTP